MIATVGRGRRLRWWALAALGLALTRLTGCGAEDDEGPHAFLQTGDRGQPLVYPCAPIHYTVSTPRAPDDFEQVVHGAVGLVSAASGYAFVYDGPTTDRDFRAHLTPGRAGPVLIGFAVSAEVPGLTGDVAGLGGSVPSRDGVHYSTGVVMLDASVYRRDDALEYRRAIVMHELGHVLGLGHVEDDGELMNDDNLGRTDFGPGDVAGLLALRAASCPPGP